MLFFTQGYNRAKSNVLGKSSKNISDNGLFAHAEHVEPPLLLLLENLYAKMTEGISSESEHQFRFRNNLNFRFHP